MFFCELRRAFIDYLQKRVQNGEDTERSLAKLFGISQPHLHNVLKGVRTLSPELIDRCLYQLRMSALDLVDPVVLAAYVSESLESRDYSYLPVLQGKLGPGHPLPDKISTHQRFPIARAAIRRLSQPVVASLGADPCMEPLLNEGDLVLLDQSPSARTEIRSDALYVVKIGRTGLVRMLIDEGATFSLATPETVEIAEPRERQRMIRTEIAHVVRARASLLSREIEWSY